MIEAYCAHCFRIETAKYTLPTRCPQCQTQTPWRPMTERPRDFWNPTENDRKFLRSARISPD